VPDPAEVITVTLGGRTFRTGRRTAAHLEWTIERLTKTHPDAPLRIMQGSYNTAVAASAGTHDKDGVIDCAIDGPGWLEQQRFFRMHGWAAWWRRPDQGFSNHIHMISLGCPGPLGAFVPRQIDDYWNHRDGLSTHALDPTFFPKDIDSTIFDYPAWLERQWFEMATKAELREVVDAAIGGRLDTLLERTEGLRVTLAGIVTDLDALEVEVADDATKELVRKMRDQVIEALSFPGEST
jgi:hypothetical protein